MSYPNEIPGLRFVAKTTTLNTDPGSIYYTTSDFSRESAVGLLRELPSNFEITFWNHTYPNGKTDPGAFVTVRRNGRSTVVMLGNHGWTSKWKVTGIETLASELFANRESRFGDDEDHLGALIVRTY
jgi:hypothetical protein